MLFSDAPPDFNAALAELEAEQWNRAIELLAARVQELELLPGSPDWHLAAYLVVGVASVHAGRYEQAVEYLTAILDDELKEHPFWEVDHAAGLDVDTYYIFASFASWAQEGVYSSSDLSSARPLAHDHRAKAYRALGEFGRAAADLQCVLDSRCIHNYSATAMLNYTIGMYHGAAQQFEAAVPFLERAHSYMAEFRNLEADAVAFRADWFLLGVKFSCFNQDLYEVDHPLLTETTIDDAFYYILGRGVYEEGKIGEALYCFRWTLGWESTWREDDYTPRPIASDANLWHSHVLRLSGLYNEAASFLADCLAGWPSVTDELLVESVLLIVSAPEVCRLFGPGGCFSGVRFVPRLASVLQESERWVREALERAFPLMLVQDKALKIAEVSTDTVEAMHLLRRVRDSDAPSEVLVAEFARFAQAWLSTQRWLVRDALELSLRLTARTEEGVETSEEPVRWSYPCSREEPAAPGLEVAFAAHSRDVTALSFSPGSERLLTGSLDGSVGLWDVNGRGLDCRIVPQPRRSVIDAAFSPDGRHCAVAVGRAVVLYDPLLERVVTTLHHAFDLKRLLWTPDGKSLLTLSNDVLRRWNIDSASVVEKHEWTRLYTEYVFQFACSPAGHVACASRENWFDASGGYEIKVGLTDILEIDGHGISEVQAPAPGHESDYRGEPEGLLLEDFPLTLVDDATLIAFVSNLDWCEERGTRLRTWRNIGGRWVADAADEAVLPDFVRNGHVGRNQAGDLFLVCVDESPVGQPVFRICPLTQFSRVPITTFGQGSGLCDPGSRIVVSPDGTRLATSTEAGAVAIWNLGMLLKAGTDR